MLEVTNLTCEATPCIQVLKHLLPPFYHLSFSEPLESDGSRCMHFVDATRIPQCIWLCAATAAVDAAPCQMHAVGLVQGPRMVRDVFRLAKENEPAIIFIDEVDAIATARFDAQTGADRCGRLASQLAMRQPPCENWWRGVDFCTEYPCC